MSNDHKVLTRQGYICSKKKLQKDKLLKTKKDLTVTPIVNQDYNADVESFEVYKENKGSVCVPRYYGVKHFGEPNKVLPLEGVGSRMRFKRKLRPNQEPIRESCLKEINEKGGGIVSLPCGYGKTIIALNLACELGLKTLVIVHKTFLQNQWYERIKEFTNAKIGMIRQRKTDVNNKDIVIGMLQSISMIDYDMDIFNDFGTVIIDECFIGREKIMTDIGPMRIDNLYEIWYRGGLTPKIKSFNEDSKKFEYKNLTFAWKKDAEDLVKVTFKERNIISTPNHLYLTIDGYKEAGKLTPNDIMVARTEKHNKNYCKGLNDDQVQVIIGSFLGGARISRTKNGSYELTQFQSLKKSEYSKWKSGLFGVTSHLVDVGLKSRLIGFTTPQFHSNYDFSKPEGHCNQHLVDLLNLRGFSIWLMDSAVLEGDEVNMITSSLDESFQNLLVDRIKSLGINCHSSKGLDGRFRIVLERLTENTELLTYLRPFMLQNLGLKGQGRSYNWNTKFRNYSTCRISSVSHLDPLGSRYVYDIEVADNHNFIVRTKNNSGIVVHNCHHVGSRVFSQALYKTGAKYTIGLSATPFRSDGLTKVINWYLGDIIYRIQRKGDKNVVVKMFNYESNDKLYIEKKMWIKGKIKPAVQKMITNMYKMKGRNKFLVDIINSLKNQYERKILVLSGRLEHLNILKKSVDELIKEEEEKDLLEPGECTTAFYIGGMKEYELVESAEADIIFGTFAMAEEGLDIDKLNTIVFATPKRNIIQSIGRIMRKPIKEGDIKPMIVDIHDDLSVFTNWGNIRKKYYKKNKYEIDYYQAWNDRCVSIKDYLLVNKLVKKDEEFDVRKEFMCHKYGEEYYELEKDMGFENDDENDYYYVPVLDEIFDIQYGIAEEVVEDHNQNNKNNQEVK